MTEPKVGESWYVRLKGALVLLDAEIRDVTPLTVAIYDNQEGYHWFPPRRYARADVEFIERREPPPEKSEPPMPFEADTMAHEDAPLPLDVSPQERRGG